MTTTAITTTKYHDTIIIGSGLSGLYSAYKIKSKNPLADVLILERSNKSGLGGRIGNHMFYGTEVPIGAGIGRKNKDRLLRELLTKFGLYDGKLNTVDPQYSDTVVPIDIMAVTNHLRSKYNSSYRNHTFKQFATEVLADPDIYRRFIVTSGYTDYENEDACETLFHYGLEDNTCCWKSFHVPWQELAEKLYEFIGDGHFRFSQGVTKIEKTEEDGRRSYSITVNDQTAAKYLCRKVIIATTIDTVRALLKLPIYNDICGQPFLRLYAKFTKYSAEILASLVKGYTILSGPLQKIIPMNPEKGVYMIAYSDNKNATRQKPYKENTEQNRKMYCSLLEIALGIKKNTLNIIAIRDYYWDIGTHYYKPLDRTKYRSREEFIWKAQHPDEGILVVGEAVSRNQGWTEGALESVKAVL